MAGRIRERRAQRLRRSTAALAARSLSATARFLARSSVTVTAPPIQRRWPCDRGVLPSPLLVAGLLGHLFGLLLALLEGLVDRLPTGDGGGDLLGDRRPKRLELGNADVLDARVGPRLRPGVVDVGLVDRLDGEVGEGGRRLLVLRDLVGRQATARRHPRPAELLADDMNFQAASLFLEVDGIASDQAQSQPDHLVSLTGAGA